MKHLKAISVLSSAMLCISFSGCDLVPPTEKQESSANENQHTDIRMDIAEIRKTAEALKETWTYQNKEDEIKAVLQELSDRLEESYAVYARAMIASDADRKNSDLYALKNQTYQDYYVISDIFNWVTANGWRNSMYSDLFKSYITDDDIDYYLVNNLGRIIAYAKSSASDNSALLDEYYESANDGSSETGDINLKCAELYLKALEKYSNTDDIYNNFHRDYTPEQIKQVYDEIVDRIVPLFNELDGYVASIAAPVSHLECSAYDVLKEQAPKLSPEIEKSVQKLFDEELYTAAIGDDCYSGSYTITLAGEQRALMYTYLDNTFYDIITVSHEFGHFHSDLNITTPICMQISNIDIAEAQSQCMEMIFTSRYPDIFGQDASYYELLELYNMMDNIISGFAVGQFENDVANQIDTITPQEVLDLYQEYYDTCNLGSEFYQISHLFEEPGYYISYGVSALPAIQIYTLMQDDYSSAIAKYGILSKISAVSGDSCFSEAMASCGFDSCFEPESIASIADQLSKRIDELKAS